MFSMLATDLTERLREKLSWKNARLECLGILIVSILRHRTVNLVKLSAEASSETKAESLYRRFQNFFLRFDMPLDDIGRLVLSKLPTPKGGWVLAMDRTNWKFGKTHINILVIAVVTNKVAIPICWMVLPQSTKRGNSHTNHRIKLLNRLLKLLSAEDIKVLTMDREFIGKHWLEWLNNQGVKYVVRIKHNVIIDGVAAAKYRHHKQLRSSHRKSVWDTVLFFAGCKITGKNTRDDFLYLVSNHYHGKEALDLYKQRWGVEVVFSHFKKRGFDLETTHMCDDKKIEKLFAVLTLAFLISYGWGCEMAKNSKLSATQKRKSVFRLGLDQISRLFTHKDDFEREIQALLEWFMKPKYHSIFVV
jgi:hypothetical protein